MPADDHPEGSDDADEPGSSGDPGRSETTGPGSVILVGTPIGNLGDLSPRAVRTFTEVDTVYCEDTRHTRKLLTHAGLAGVVTRSLYEHNEDERIPEILGAVAAGRSVAVVSDAGMPGISDPGSRLVASAADAGVTVSVVPGPSSVLAALVVSGLSTDRFVVEGFLPRSGRERTRRLDAVAGEERTTVLLEAPGRVAATVADLAGHCGGGRRVVVARELTKVHEEVYRGTLDDAEAWARERTVRGEVVLVLEGTGSIPAPEVADEAVIEALRRRLDAGERTRGAVDAVAAELGLARRRVYDLALAEPGRAGNAPSGPGVDPSGG